MRRLKLQRLCVADYKSLIAKTLCIAAATSEIYLLDYGISTIELYSKEMKIKLGKVARYNFDSASMLDIIIDQKYPIKNIFTMMRLKSTETYEIATHNFDIFNGSQLKNIPIDQNAAIFIISKVVECGMCSIEYFEYCIEDFCNQNQGKNLIYLLHRAEDFEKLKKWPTLKPVRLSLPVELSIGSEVQFPIALRGFYSAALLYFSHTRADIDVQNYSIQKNESKFEFNDVIIYCNLLFDALKRGEFLDVVDYA